MGEGFGIYSLGDDTAIMPYIDMANLACGFHASDPLTMYRSIQLAQQHRVQIGCHPAYPDLVGFGRRAMACSPEEIYTLILYQLGALDGLCQSLGTQVSYLKPHGALYNTMMQEPKVFQAILHALKEYNPSIKLMILSTTQNHHYASVAETYGIKLLYEVFADRGYDDHGKLIPRTQQGALLNHQEALERAQLLLSEGVIKSINGKKLPLQADTLCVHGDSKEALEIIKDLHAL